MPEKNKGEGPFTQSRLAGFENPQVKSVKVLPQPPIEPSAKQQREQLEASLERAKKRLEIVQGKYEQFGHGNIPAAEQEVNRLESQLAGLTTTLTRNFQFPNSFDDPDFARDVADMRAGDLTVRQVANRHSSYLKGKGRGKRTTAR